jgi:hypothetical protein
MAARGAGGVVVLVVALGILYLAFRGPSGHPTASVATTGRGGAVPVNASGKGAGSGGQSGVPATATGHPAASSSAASPLGPSARAYLAARTGKVQVAVYDLATGREWSLGDGAPQAEASIVKLDILETLLTQRPSGLTSSDDSLAHQMIEDSDNNAATSLWDAVGGSAGIRTYNAQAGLSRTTPSTCVQCPNFPWPGWGLTTTTPEDQITLLRRVVQAGGPLDATARSYALSLLENVTDSQRWGVSGGVPAGVTVALKNGWLPLDAANQDWQINSVGWVNGGGRDYLLAMLSTGNPSEQYGIDTLDSVGSMVWHALG